jgi:TolB-like protein
MAPAPDRSEEIAFGPFRVDVRSRALYRDGASIPLGARSFDILCILAERRDNLVTKDELMARVWPAAVVEDNTVQVHVSALRKALGEDLGGKRYIVTVPGRGYRFVPDSVEAAEPPLPDKPSIAVMPFDNMSDDPGQDYFADGMVDDIITALTRFPALFVIARNSSFVYRGRSVDIRQVGRDLGVQYVLEGSVRRSNDRLRITGQLIDASTGTHLWAERSEGKLSDVFDLQDEITARIVGAIGSRVQLAEIERAKRVPTGSLRSYDCYLRGLALFHRDDREANREALLMFEKAIGLDPDFAAAHGMAAWCHMQRYRNGWMSDLPQGRRETRQLAMRAIELGRDDAIALTTAGSALAQVVHELDTGIALTDRARELNPNLATAWSSSAWLNGYAGNADVAIEHAARAIRLSPVDPLSHYMDAATAFGHFIAGRYGEAIAWAEKALPKHEGYQASYRILAASYAHAGRVDSARLTVKRLRERNPTMRLSDLRTIIPWRRQDDLRRYTEGLRMAGLPE